MLLNGQDAAVGRGNFRIGTYSVDVNCGKTLSDCEAIRSMNERRLGEPPTLVLESNAPARHRSRTSEIVLEAIYQLTSLQSM